MLNYYRDFTGFYHKLAYLASGKLYVMILLVLSVIFCGCTGDRCIDADDFGFIKLNISARDIARDSNPSSDLTQDPSQDTQIAPWIDSGFRVTGGPLTIMVRYWDQETYDNSSDELSAWCPWFGTADNKDTLSDFCMRLRECEFIGEMCTTTRDAQIKNPPCIFKRGVGLYALISRPNTRDPNLSYVTQLNPDGITIHIGESRHHKDRPETDYDIYDIDKSGNFQEAGGVDYRYSEGDSMKYANGPLFFKILDKFYDDNNGQYRVVIKSGVFDTRPDPLTFLTKLIKEQFFGSNTDEGLVKKIYQNIIKKPGYRLSVSAMLTLYIMFTAFSFLIGNLNITHTELIVRVIKISVVSALLSSNYSWSFFNDYLFQYFVGGVEQIKLMIENAANSGPGPSSIINLMIAPQTMAKLFSLLFLEWRGFIYIILFFIALYFAFMMMFEATVIYLTALLTIGMIIVMGPIFVCFLLFNITRSLFENWLKQLISYAIQPIILFTGLAFMSNIISTEIYGSLGFAVCKHDFPNLGPMGKIFGKFTKEMDISLGNSMFYWWFPNAALGKGFAKTKGMIPVPIDHYQDVPGGEPKFCKAFECIEKRYIELPFLDPVADQQRANDFFNGNFVQLGGLWIIFIAIYLLSKFNGLAVSTASFIASTSGNLTDLQKAGTSAFAPIKAQMDRPLEASYKAVADIPKKMRKWANKNAETNPKLAGALYIASNPLGAASDALAQWYQDKQFGRLREKALTNDANKLILDEVKRTYGLEQKDIKLDAVKNYKAALREALKAVNPEISEKKLQSLSELDYSKLKGEFAKMLDEKGKPLDKGKVDELMKKEAWRDLARDAKLTNDFQNAYVEAHQALSEKGIGFFGKRISGLRTLEEMNNRVDEKRGIKQGKRTNLGQRIYAGYEELKRGAFTSITGESLRDTLEGSMTGAAWHDFERNDPRLRTYSEKLQDQKAEIEYMELQKKINRETVNQNNDILSPEYLAKLAAQGLKDDVDCYKDLARQKLSHEIYGALTKEEVPALMGEKFMRERATDDQFKEMIDQSYAAQEKLIENDRYIRREDHYTNMHEKSIEDIQMMYKGLSEHYDRNDIKAEELPVLLEKYYDQPDAGDLFAGKSLDYFKKSLNTFDYSKRILEEIEERKMQIAEEVSGHIDNINEHRKEAKMSEYKKPIVPETRKLRTIEGHLPK